MRILLIFLVILTGGLNAMAGGEQPDVIMSEQGTCQKLVVLSHDLTQACHDTLLNTIYNKIGRTGFYFVSGNAVVTFSGGGKQIKPNPDTAVQPLDRVVFNEGSGTGVGSFDAVGTCRYTNPYEPNAYVRCHAETEQGTFDALFLTNGAPPRRIK